MRNNLVTLMLESAQQHSDRLHIRYFAGTALEGWTYAEVRRRYERIAGGLASLGIEPGDRVAIYSENRAEWALADYGSIAAGAVVVSVYSTLPADEAAYILEHSDSKLVFVGNAGQLWTLLKFSPFPSELKRIVILDGDVTADVPQAFSDRVMTLSQLEQLGDGKVGAERIALTARTITPEMPIALSYTSGTTGVPKGAILTHGNVLTIIDRAIEACAEQVPELTSNLSFLPLSHVLERFGGHWWPMSMGATVNYARSIDTIGEDFIAVKPRFAIVVPRVLEKVHNRIYMQLQSAPRVKRMLFHWAVKVGRVSSEHIEYRKPMSPWLRAQRALADRLVFKKIRERLGGNILMLVCGGAPLAADLERFFHGMGVMISGGWGLTETSAPATLNTPSSYRIGSVGSAIPGVEIKVAEDGELLVRGPNVFKGYFKDDEATKEAFDEDGFFRTGDIGHVDADGFFYITDRKKELIVTASGKNIAPQKVENLIKGRRYISNCLVHGDRRNYLVALITVDRESIRSRHPDVADRPADDPNLRFLIQRQVDHANERLARFEQVKDFRIIDQDFTPETGELTVTLKLKRRVVEQKHKSLLNEMYGAA